MPWGSCGPRGRPGAACATAAATTAGCGWSCGPHTIWTGRRSESWGTPWTSAWRRGSTWGRPACHRRRTPRRASSWRRGGGRGPWRRSWSGWGRRPQRRESSSVSARPRARRAGASFGRNGRPQASRRGLRRRSTPVGRRPSSPAPPSSSGWRICPRASGVTSRREGSGGWRSCPSSWAGTCGAISAWREAPTRRRGPRMSGRPCAWWPPFWVRSSIGHAARRRNGPWSSSSRSPCTWSGSATRSAPTTRGPPTT